MSLAEEERDEFNVSGVRSWGPEFILFAFGDFPACRPRLKWSPGCPVETTTMISFGVVGPDHDAHIPEDMSCCKS